MHATSGRLIGAFLFSPEGRVRELDWSGVRSSRPEQGWLWNHFDRTDPATGAWLREESGLGAITGEALLEEETRPRLGVDSDGQLLVILRGVNLNPDAEPDGMISLRAVFSPQRVITLRPRRLLAFRHIREGVAAGNGPRSPADLLVAIAVGLVGLQAAAIDGLAEVVDRVEQDLVDAHRPSMRARISASRCKAIGLRRYSRRSATCLCASRRSDSRGSTICSARGCVRSPNDRRGWWRISIRHAIARPSCRRSSPRTGRSSSSAPCTWCRSSRRCSCRWDC
jgi:zinc transporter